ncbi:hypothetical protein EMCRGX_G006807 [Ephydatia muelleri]
MTLKGALLLSRLVNRSAHLWFAVQFAVSWCARGERPIDEAIRRLAVGRKNVYSASEGKPASFFRAANEVNNLKRPLKSGSHELPTIEDFETVPSPPSSHVTPEAAKSTSHSSQPATTKQVSTPSRSQMELPLRAGTTRHTALSGSEIANVVDEADAVLVTKKWWSRSHATKPSLNSVVSAIDDAGFQGQRRTVR